mmetsp:Transcript_27197/g.45490  ORF Transcript_27197/g.45490 Transcript_27197/m.45490 type:complete len:230 (-) Transcript_27197:173-862(-)
MLSCFAKVKGIKSWCGIVCIANFFSAAMATTATPWLTLLKSNMRDNPNAGYVTIATVENSRPRARMVLFSGLVERDNKVGIAIKTSSLSRKVQNADNEFVEIVWWFEDTATQFRFGGPIDYENHPEERDRLWSRLNPAARSQFFYTGGLDKSTSGVEFEKQNAAFQKSPNVPPDMFHYGVVYPDSVDILNLSSLERHLFEKKEGDATWTEASGYAPPVVSTTTSSETCK